MTVSTLPHAGKNSCCALSMKDRRTQRSFTLRRTIFEVGAKFGITNSARDQRSGACDNDQITAILQCTLLNERQCMNTINEIITDLPTLASNAKISDPTIINKIHIAAQSWTGTDEKLVDKFHDVVELYAKISQLKLSKLCRDMKVKGALQASPDGYEEFVEAWTSKHDVRFTIDRRLSMAGKDVSDNDVLNKMILWTSRYEKFERKDTLTAAWKEWRAETFQRELQSFRDRIAHSADAPDEWSRILDVLLRDDGSIQNYRLLAEAVLKGAIWRVKNKLAGNAVGQHIMPYLRGKQGCGKTTFMRWLLLPVEDGVTNATFDMFTHDEKTYILRDSPIVFFDEVARAHRADVNIVKNLMTSETAMFRKLYGEATKGRILSTFFGAGNLELEEVFNDPTGLRRFFQIEVRQDLCDNLKPLQSEIDPLDLWRCVDENAPSPLASDEIIEALKVVQRETHAQTPLERWLTDLAVNGGTGDFQEVSELFRCFRQWLDEANCSDNTTLFQFQNQLSRTLKDQPEGKFPYQHQKHPMTRRSQYRIDAVTVPTTRLPVDDDDDYMRYFQKLAA